MTRTQPFTRVASVILSAAGSGVTSAGPSITSEVWQVQTASVKCSTNGSEATCSLFQGAAGSIDGAAYIDGTTWGSTGDSTTNFSGPVFLGQAVYAEWTGGDPGAVATVVFQGTRQVP